MRISANVMLLALAVASCVRAVPVRIHRTASVLGRRERSLNGSELTELDESKGLELLPRASPEQFWLFGQNLLATSTEARTPTSFRLFGQEIQASPSVGEPRIETQISASTAPAVAVPRTREELERHVSELARQPNAYIEWRWLDEALDTLRSQNQPKGLDSFRAEVAYITLRSRLAGPSGAIPKGVHIPKPDGFTKAEWRRAQKTTDSRRRKVLRRQTLLTRWL